MNESSTPETGMPEPSMAAMSTMTVLYRTHAGENNGLRPSWYSKSLCLASLARAVMRARADAPVRFVLLHDGPLNANVPLIAALEHLPGLVDAFEHGERRGNAGSFRHAFHLALECDDNEPILFAEDDYFWLEESIAAMRTALTTLPADYVTGYDHPDRYRQEGPVGVGVDLPHRYTKIHLAAGRHWRTQESTCMTFMTTAGRLRTDAAMFEAFADSGNGIPADCVLFRLLQGLLPHGDGSALLFGPMPSLNTHAHVPFLAPFVDWEGYAADVRAHMNRSNQSNQLIHATATS